MANFHKLISYQNKILLFFFRHQIKMLIGILERLHNLYCVCNRRCQPKCRLYPFLLFGHDLLVLKIIDPVFRELCSDSFITPFVLLYQPLCFCGIAAEMFFVWMPLLNLNKWYKKMPYFKYLFKTLF